MRRKTSLYLVSKDCSDGTVAALAEAAKDQNAYLACLILGSPPGRPYFVSGTSAIGAAAMPADWIDRFKEAKQTAETRAAAVNRLLTDTGCAGDVQYAVCAGADIRLICAQRAKTCDIAQVSADLREHEDVFGEALHGLLFQSPIPVLLNGSPFSKYGRVFLAWDSSLAAARAAHAALPYFLRAQEVVVGCFSQGDSDQRSGEDPGTDVAAWLSHHGCNVTVSQFPGGSFDVGRDIQKRAREAGAALVVMGGYGHSRLREAVFGGTTRTMIEQSELPVLIAH